jgi:hypothetical protein
MRFDTDPAGNGGRQPRDNALATREFDYMQCRDRSRRWRPGRPSSRFVIVEGPSPFCSRTKPHPIKCGPLRQSQGQIIGNLLNFGKIGTFMPGPRLRVCTRGLRMALPIAWGSSIEF